MFGKSKAARTAEVRERKAREYDADESGFMHDELQALAAGDQAEAAMSDAFRLASGDLANRQRQGR